jgi:hypothetical protein
LQVRRPFNETSLYFKKERKVVAYAVIAAIIVVNSVILFSPTTDGKNYAGSILRPVVAGVAVTFSLIVVYRQKLDGLLGRAYGSLAIGLVLWLAAELVWAYYTTILRIALPLPSLADVFWLLGYGPLGYHLFSIAKLQRAFHNASKRIFVVSIAITIFSIVYIFNIASASLASPSSDYLALAISITYPIADAIVIVPAVLTISKSGRGELTAVPWIFISWIFTAVADALYGYTAVTNIAGDFFIWNLFYNAAYLIMAVGLYWHNKFFVMDDAKMIKLWNKENR